ncbi:hypothetical protein Pmani_016076 [Petrolisthes manimaculis]|uniref:Uncharacterized protein n=1 Tax=Petrolisthes manimaculis TaxID=1843537 RepID=A0AAE1UBC1_9EUCA|nr:hypothetical protein Pmani_016076 [Petrolisthes manimaculis]
MVVEKEVEVVEKGKVEKGKVEKEGKWRTKGSGERGGRWRRGGGEEGKVEEGRWRREEDVWRDEREMGSGRVGEM